MKNDLPRFPFVAIGGLLVGEAILFASAHYCWFEFNRHKGWTPLIAMAVALAWLVLLFTWIGISRLLRRPAQFGLGTLLALIFVAALPCAWVANEIRKAHKRSELVRAIEDEGGSVFQRVPTGAPQAAPWLKAILGTNYFSEVSIVKLRTPLRLDQITDWYELEYLDLSQTPTTNEDLDLLVAFHELRILRLADTEISNEGMHRIARLTGLSALYIHCTKITDDGLPALYNLKELELLWVSERALSDDAKSGLMEQLPDVGIVEYVGNCQAP